MDQGGWRGSCSSATSHLKAHIDDAQKKAHDLVEDYHDAAFLHERGLEPLRNRAMFAKLATDRARRSLIASPPMPHEFAVGSDRAVYCRDACPL